MPTNTITNNKLIAKNALLLYLRMFVIMAIGFYTSRIVLVALGVSDYGIFNLVGGIIVMINILNTALSSASNRFLTYALGKNESQLLSSTFSTTVIVHCSLALLFFVVAETLGLWFVNTQLNIDTGRMGAANWVYQAAIISTIFGITQVPYNALVTSHEKFNIFAYVEILSAILKLLIVFIVLNSSFDHLIFYSILYAMISVIIMSIYRYYSKHKFEEARVTWSIDKKLTKEILAFSGWGLFSSSSLTICQQGLNIFLNWFWGTVLNAAAGVAGQVQSILYSFIGNITVAFSPQLIKEYAQCKYERVNYLIFFGSRLSAIFTLLISVPVFIKMEYLMNLWLDEVPMGTVVICQILLVKNFTNSLNPLVYIAISASGKIKKTNILCGIVYLLSLVITYIIIYYTKSYFWAFVWNLSTSVICLGIYIRILHEIMPLFKISYFICKVIIPLFFIGFVVLILGLFLFTYMDDNFWSLILVIFYSSILIMGLSLMFAFNSDEKRQIGNYVHGFVRANFRMK